MMKKRFNPIKDRSSEIVAFLMASPDMPKDEDVRFKIELSIEEAVENVVRYAYEGGIGWLEAGWKWMILTSPWEPMNDLLEGSASTSANK